MRPSARPTAFGLRTGHGERGFSLLEVLVALAIMALSLGALYEAAGGSVRSAQVVEQRGTAILLAQSLLDSRDTVDAGGFDLGGEHDGRFRWRLSARPFVTGREAVPGWPLYRVEAVASHDARSLPSASVEGRVR